MRWTGGRRSGNVEDRRGRGGMIAGGGIGALLIGIVAMLLGVDPGEVVPPGATGGPAGQAPAGAPPADDAAADTVRLMLGDMEDTWTALFQRAGQRYEAPVLTLFDGGVSSACGFAQSAVGPFYCPRDRKVYIDLSFFRDLEQRFGASGDFAQAYVIAHEVGHHVQTITGISERVNAASARASKEEANALSVRQELQADCYAGVWGYHADKERQRLEPGEVEEALRAAAAIGDDRLQKQTQGYVVPESFTHGSSEQRVRWFRRGFESGDPGVCDTFSAGTV